MKRKVLVFNFAFGLLAVVGYLVFYHNASAGPRTSYYNMSIKRGLQLIANQLNGQTSQSNAVQAVLPNVADGTTLHKFINGDFTTNTFFTGSWTYPNEALPPGDRAFIFNPAASSITITFAGDLLQGELSNAVAAGLSLKSSMAFKSGGVTTDLGLNLAPFDNLYQWETNHFVVYTVLPGGGWYPSEPKIAIAESFFVNSASGTNWVQTYQP